MHHTDILFDLYLHQFIYCDFKLMYQLTLSNIIWLPLDIRRALYDIKISPGFLLGCFLASLIDSPLLNCAGSSAI